MKSVLFEDSGRTAQ